MLEPEGDRIGAGGMGELVHERFDGEHVGIGAQRAQRRDAQGLVGNQVVHYLT